MKYAFGFPLEFAASDLHLLTADFLTPPDWNHTNLRAPYWRFYWNPQPGAAIQAEKKITLDAEHIILIPPETSFSSHADSPIQHFYMHFLTAVQIRANRPFSRPITPTERRFLIKLTDTSPPRWNRWNLIALLARYLAKIPEDCWHDATVEPPPPIKHALSLIHSRLPAPTPTAQLAHEVGMNVNAFIRLFRESVNSTPAAFQKTKRIELACVLLHHREDSIDTVAETCGFCDRHHFSRVFKAERGISPARFRANLILQETGRSSY